MTQSVPDEDNKSSLPGAGEGTEPSPDAVRYRQHLRRVVSGGLILLVGVCLYYLAGGDPSPGKESPNKKLAEQKPRDMVTPLSAVDERELWVSRVEKKVDHARQEAAGMRAEHQLLHKKIDVLESLLTTSGTQNLDKPSSVPATPDSFTQAGNPSVLPPPAPFPPPDHSRQSVAGELADMPLPPPGKPPRKRGAKILHLAGGSGIAVHSPELYLPGGTYCKAVIDMGVAVSTAVNSQGNPEPIRLRLVDNGNLPGGLKGQIRDAVMIGACYGDISSERARCRLETLSWRDKQGIQVEKKIEGWIVGEDGVAGIRGKIVDRSSDIAREAFGAGMLSAAANFLKFEANAGTYPVSPFGQTNAMSKREALQGAMGSGVSSALDKLAEFSIKRAEAMSPVVYVASGRVVDVLLKSGVELTSASRHDLHVVGTPFNRSNSELQEN